MSTEIVCGGWIDAWCYWQRDTYGRHSNAQGWDGPARSAVKQRWCHIGFSALFSYSKEICHAIVLWCENIRIWERREKRRRKQIVRTGIKQYGTFFEQIGIKQYGTDDAVYCCEQLLLWRDYIGTIAGTVVGWSVPYLRDDVDAGTSAGDLLRTQWWTIVAHEHRYLLHNYIIHKYIIHKYRIHKYIIDNT